MLAVSAFCNCLWLNYIFFLYITVPDEDRMAKRAGKALGDFKDLVFPEGYVPGAGKRKVVNY